MRWLVQSNEACPPPSATLACCDRIQDAFLPITTSSTSAHLLTAGTSCKCGSTIHVCRGRPLRCPVMVSTNDSVLRPSPGAVHSYCFFFANSAPNGPWLPTAHINPTTRPGRVSEPVDPDCWMELVQVPARNAMRCGRYVPCCVHCVCMVPSNLWLLKRPFPQTRVLRRPRIMTSGGPAVLL
jgi:hypothetical protein